MWGLTKSNETREKQKRAQRALSATQCRQIEVMWERSCTVLKMSIPRENDILSQLNVLFSPK